MGLATSPAICRFMSIVAALFGALLAASPATAQISGRAVAQPFFDFDNQARFMSCRPGPYIWGFDPFLHMDDCEEECRGGIIAHRPSTWYATADFAPMTYDANGNIELARLGPTGPTVLTSSDLDLEFDAGGRFTFGRTLGGCYQIEGTYLGVYSWQDSVTVADSSDNLSSAILGLDSNSSITAADYNSFKSAELNLRTWLNVAPGPFDVQLLVGARYMKAFERFDYSVISTSQNFATVQTQNDMAGVQIGIDLDILVNARLYYDFELKGGILQNIASQETSYSNIGGVFDTSATQHRTAFFGDMILTANWQIAPNWTLRLGYQAIFVNGLALGPQNLQTNSSLLQTGPGQLDDSGEAIYHGPVLGVGWTR